MGICSSFFNSISQIVPKKQHEHWTSILKIEIAIVECNFSVLFINQQITL